MHLSGGDPNKMFKGVYSHAAAELLSPIGWVSWGAHLSIAAHAEVNRRTVLDRIHFATVWFHFLCCATHCIFLSQNNGTSDDIVTAILIGFVPAIVMLPVGLFSNDIRFAIKKHFGSLVHQHRYRPARDGRGAAYLRNPGEKFRVFGLHGLSPV